ncbi:uncharacterized protein LOC121740262 [Aricia agestis]|uniref:uncharacterized protein LOC121740262 n=1 Tax=Aricia agestis TaxID=91739 RepID=UPI001C2091EB|nr:uncharacterized protein LOC121740262 [Aricia agestis]
MSSHNNMPPDKNTNPFERRDGIPRSPPTSTGKRLLSQLSPSSVSPVEKRHQPIRDEPQSPVISLLDTSSAVDDSFNYCELVREASSYLGKINEFANDTVSRRNNFANKSDIMNLTQKLTTIVSLLAIKNSSLETKVANLERDLLSVKLNQVVKPAPAATPVSYSEALKLKLAKSVPPVETRKPLPCVIAYPTQEKSAELKSAAETKQALMKVINPADGFQFHGVKKTANSGVLLRLTSESQVKKLKSVEALKSAGLRLETPKGRSPRILIKDVPQHITDDNFLLSLYNQNVNGEINVTQDQFMSSTKIVRRRILNKEYNNRKWIGIELDPKVRQHLIETKEKLFIDWAMCRFVDDVELVRCANCQQYGHTAKFCRDTKPCCKHCAEGHSSDSCPKKDKDDFKPVCGSCLRYKKPTDHPTGSPDCPTYKSKMEQLILTTRYG